MNLHRPNELGVHCPPDGRGAEPDPPPGPRWDTHSLGPIVGYLEARETEAEALRMIFGAIQGGFEPQLPSVYA